jgi:hypothetical protein
MKRLTMSIATIVVAASIMLLASGTPVIARSSSNLLQITSKTLLLTGPTTAPAAGDRYVYYETDTGGDHGKDYFNCVVTNPRGDTLCSAEFVLKHGDISIEGVFDAIAATTNVSAAITGGTGRYNAASGTVIATGPPINTHFAFHFAS